jgi:molybdopterin converting factor small subunit
MVTIRLPGQLRNYAGGQEFIDVAASTVEAALRELVVAYPDLGVRFFDDENRLHSHPRGSASTCSLPWPEGLMTCG